MYVYEFELRFILPSGEFPSDEMIERLGDAGCDDALIGVGRAGRIALDFARRATSAHDAILSAVRDVKRAIPDAQLIEVTPDLVGVTDVAELVGRSRQNIRQLMVACDSGAPVPLHEGNAALWHLAPVLEWLSKEKDYAINDRLLEVSNAAMKVNVAVESLRSDKGTIDHIRALLV